MLFVAGARINQIHDLSMKKTQIIETCETKLVKFLITVLRLDIGSKYMRDPMNVPIHWALKNRDCINVINMLIAMKIGNVDDSNYSGQTPFLKAVILQNLPAMRLLLELGANPDTTDRNNQSALHWAVNLNNNIDIFELVITHSNHNKVIELVKSRTAEDWCPSRAKVLVKRLAVIFFERMDMRTTAVEGQYCKSRVVTLNFDFARTNLW
ncbi:hypothetical protein QAD02_018283 [Eretmocerus hayati]|uniref:Uncharacterized protein n=1 Tax=Eretmocerus hayati TaxID=131215 RepID=A0ACC2PG91_9HYME|nr:hypothetical protein QAD02_018283 [Eretmocerus hayati]